MKIHVAKTAGEWHLAPDDALTRALETHIERPQGYGIIHIELHPGDLKYIGSYSMVAGRCTDDRKPRGTMPDNPQLLLPWEKEE